MVFLCCVFGTRAKKHNKSRYAPVEAKINADFLFFEQEAKRLLTETYERASERATISLTLSEQFRQHVEADGVAGVDDVLGDVDADSTVDLTQVESMIEPDHKNDSNLYKTRIQDTDLYKHSYTYVYHTARGEGTSCREGWRVVFVSSPENVL